MSQNRITPLHLKVHHVCHMIAITTDMIQKYLLFHTEAYCMQSEVSDLVLSHHFLSIWFMKTPIDITSICFCKGMQIYMRNIKAVVQSNTHLLRNYTRTTHFLRYFYNFHFMLLYSTTPFQRNIVVFTPQLQLLATLKILH